MNHINDITNSINIRLKVFAISILLFWFFSTEIPMWKNNFKRAFGKKKRKVNYAWKLSFYINVKLRTHKIYQKLH